MKEKMLKQFSFTDEFKEKLVLLFILSYHTSFFKFGAWRYKS